MGQPDLQAKSINPKHSNLTAREAEYAEVAQRRIQTASLRDGLPSLQRRVQLPGHNKATARRTPRISLVLLTVKDALASRLKCD